MAVEPADVMRLSGPGELGLEVLMALTFYYLSGSPYAWRVWLALEHKGISYQLRTMSYDAGDFQKPEFAALNPRRRVPVIDDDGFVLYESAAIVEYLDEKSPDGARLFSSDLRQRAIQRRMVREADQYFATSLEHLVEAVLLTPPERRSQETIDAAWEGMRAELALWEGLIQGDWLAGDLSAADFTLFPEVALGQRIAQRNPGFTKGELLGSRLQAWKARMMSLPVVQKTWPPHWEPG
jgi:glutathione S-transferase